MRKLYETHPLGSLSISTLRKIGKYFDEVIEMQTEILVSTDIETNPTKVLAHKETLYSLRMLAEEIRVMIDEKLEDNRKTGDK